MTDGFKRSCGNVFEDLQLSHPDERLAKAQLLHEIRKIIEQRALKESEVQTLFEMDSARLQALRHGQLSRFSMHRLIRFLVALGHDVNITVKPKPKTRERARVQVKTA